MALLGGLRERNGNKREEKTKEEDYLLEWHGGAARPLYVDESTIVYKGVWGRGLIHERQSRQEVGKWTRKRRMGCNGARTSKLGGGQRSSISHIYITSMSRKSARTPAPRFGGGPDHLKEGSRSGKLEKARNAYNFTPNPIKPSEFPLSNARGSY